jgi:hypothetical protein
MVQNFHDQNQQRREDIDNSQTCSISDEITDSINLFSSNSKYLKNIRNLLHRTKDTEKIGTITAVIP